MKTCSKCGEEKSLNQFPRSGKKSDGSIKYRSRCKECNQDDCRQYRLDNLEKERNRVSKYNKENREKRRDYSRQYRVDNLGQTREATRRWRSENRESELETNRRKYWSDPKKIRKLRRSYYRKDREKNLLRARKYRMNNPDKIREATQRRRARRLSLFWHNVPDGYLITRDGLFCGWCSCGLPEDLTGVHRDHIMPLALGGPHTYNNLTLSCQPCNSRKSARDPLEFVLEESDLRPSVFVSTQLEWLSMSRFG